MSTPAFHHRPVYLRLIGQEGDVDLRQSLDEFGSSALHHFIKQRIGAGWKAEKQETVTHNFNLTSRNNKIKKKETQTLILKLVNLIDPLFDIQHNVCQQSSGQ